MAYFLYVCTVLYVQTVISQEQRFRQGLANQAQQLDPNREAHLRLTKGPG